ncbi:FadR/GntR family transcriptional regulator [Paraburkholderia sp. D1E]|uniref:FadR/GntR family transcriptional regulator n=1 Tax=Paraburkholderia sp. D1E TaxID=3461398 RepID=UPI0040467FD4
MLGDLRERILSGQLPHESRLPTEKQLADGYGVSEATIREALREQVTAQLVEVRHGSGSYVTAEPDQLIALSLSSMIQIERIGAPQVLGVLGGLISYAAELAAIHATQDDLEVMHKALHEIQDGENAQVISAAVSTFLGAIGHASGNPLLAALCRFFTRVQIGLGVELSGGTVESWRATASAMGKERQRVLKAIEARDPKAARTAALAYHERALKVITAQPKGSAAVVTDPALTALLSSLLQRTV